MSESNTVRLVLTGERVAFCFSVVALQGAMDRLSNRAFALLGIGGL